MPFVAGVGWVLDDDPRPGVVRQVLVDQAGMSEAEAVPLARAVVDALERATTALDRLDPRPR